MPNKESVLETWTSLKDKVGGLVDRLNNQKEINEQIVTSYQNKLKTKEETIRELEKSNPTAFISEVRKEINLSVRFPLPFNATNEQILESLKMLFGDYRRFKGL